MPPDLKAVLRTNVLALLEAVAPLRNNETGVTRLTSLGVPLGTAQRVLEAKTSIGLEKLSQIATCLGVEPWRLLLTREGVGSAQSLANAAVSPETLVSTLAALLPEQRSAIQALAATMVLTNRSKRVRRARKSNG